MSDGRREATRLKANRVYMRRVFDDGTVQVHDMELRGNCVVGDRPPPSVERCGYSEEYIVEWSDGEHRVMDRPPERVVMTAREAFDEDRPLPREALADESDIWHDLKRCEAELVEARLRGEAMAEALMFANRDKAAAFALLREAWDAALRADAGMNDSSASYGTFEEWVAKRLGRDWVTPDPADSPNT